MCVYICVCVCTHIQWNIRHKKNEIMSFVVILMDLEIVILNEVSQTEKDKYHNGYM